MNILTDDEIYELHARHYGKMYDEYTRAIEAAIMERFEVVAWMHPEEGLSYENHYTGNIPLYALKEK